MIIGYIGMPRSGKTTYVARYLHLNGYKYNHVYICGDKLVPGYLDNEDEFVTYIHPYEIGAFKPVEDSLFILCEAGTYFNNRLFAQMPQYCLNFFALHGHYKSGTAIVWESQTANIDCQLLDKCNKLYIVNKSLLPVFSHARLAMHRIEVNDQRKLDEIYDLPDGFFKKLLALITFRYHWCYRPKYYGIFDTHADILFQGKDYLDKETVYKMCPSKYLKQLTYYNELVKNDETKKTKENDKLLR